MENSLQPERRTAIAVLRGNLGICLLLAVVTLLAYSQVLHFDFLNYDDPGHTTQNPHVRDGLSLDGVQWAFTTFTEANWFPLTWLSHMACFQFFGRHAGYHHLVNVVIHILASWALFFFLLRATALRAPSAFVAFMFALHPLHVESVAWITERKDVLCALFWFLGLWAWVRDAERKGVGRYLDTSIFFALGLLSKPMIVTFPFTLLLLDLWPVRKRLSWKLFPEKWPFFLLSAGSSVVTFLAQKSGGAVQPLRRFPLPERLENAALTVWIYLEKTLWPSGLALALGWPDPMPVGLAVTGALAIAAVSYLAVRWYSARPYIAFGWFWFLGTLVPVIGLVQVGPQARADRYMYVPMVGISVIIAWGIRDLLKDRALSPVWVRGLAAAACAAMACVTWVQTSYWRTAEGLFRHTVAVTQDNELAYTYLAAQLSARREAWPEALVYFQKAVQLSPEPPVGHNNLANMYLMMGRNADALAEYHLALRADPKYASAHDGLGKLLAKTGHVDEALEHFRAVLALDPDNDNGRVDAAAGFMRAGRSDEAIAVLREGIRRNPNEPRMQNLLGVALMNVPGRIEEAIEHLERAVDIYPGFADAHNNLGIAMASSGRPTLAVEHFEEAVRLNPKFADAHHNLGIELLRLPDRREEGIQHLEEAQKLAPTPTLAQTIAALRSEH